VKNVSEMTYFVSGGT